MANRAYLRFWMHEDTARSLEEQDPLSPMLPPDSILDRFGRLLETVPLSREKPGFASLVTRALNFTETPLAEYDLRGVQCSAADVIAMARPNSSIDTACEVEAYWDLWRRDPETGGWQLSPEPLLIVCHGEAYDDGVAAESGDFLADLGFEHFFTGHGGLLGSHGARSAPADPVEAEFLARMLHEEHLHEYYEKTRENIQILLKWVRAAEHALPMDRYQLSSEGEENFEARLDEILAVR